MNQWTSIFQCIWSEIFPFSMALVSPRQVPEDNPINLKRTLFIMLAIDPEMESMCHSKLMMKSELDEVTTIKDGGKSLIHTMFHCIKWANGKNVIANHEGNLINKLTFGRKAIGFIIATLKMVINSRFISIFFQNEMYRRFYYRCHFEWADRIQFFTLLLFVYFIMDVQCCKCRKVSHQPAITIIALICFDTKILAFIQSHNRQLDVDNNVIMSYCIADERRRTIFYVTGCQICFAMLWSWWISVQEGYDFRFGIFRNLLNSIEIMSYRTINFWLVSEI